VVRVVVLDDRNHRDDPSGKAEGRGGDTQKHVAENRKGPMKTLLSEEREQRWQKAGGDSIKRV
jgi:hypothetical protein